MTGREPESHAGFFALLTLILIVVGIAGLWPLIETEFFL